MWLNTMQQNPRGKGQLPERWGNSSVRPSAIPPWVMYAWTWDFPCMVRGNSSTEWHWASGVQAVSKLAHCPSLGYTLSLPCHHCPAGTALQGRELALTSSNAFAMLIYPSQRAAAASEPGKKDAASPSRYWILHFLATWRFGKKLVVHWQTISASHLLCYMTLLSLHRV